MEKSGVVALRLFANWETDRASSSTVQRILTLNVNRLELKSVPFSAQAIILTTKLQGFKRSLRCNEVPIPQHNGHIDIDLDISFNIQYPHFLKRERNILQIMIQRKRKYKNRPIPGGFKTLAIGMINLSQLLQQGNLREILLWDADNMPKDNNPLHNMGKISLSFCQTSPMEADFENRENRPAKKPTPEGEMSEEDSESDYDDNPNDSDLNESTARTTTSNREIKNKMVRRKNLKQKFVNLLRKFKVPEEDETLAASTSASIVGAPTAKELEALFEELEDMSDSGPELGADDISIGSNPRPALRPYFTHSREVLPVISDMDAEVPSDSDNDDLDWSSEENTKQPKLSDLTTPSKEPQRVISTTSAPLTYTPNSSHVPHSLTSSSIIKSDRKHTEPSRLPSISDKLSSILTSDVLPTSVFVHSVETSYLSSCGLPLILCGSLADVKAVINQVVTRINNFCNTNSSNPPLTTVCVIGGDRLISQILRAYVDCMHLNFSTNWMHYLCFALIPPYHSLIGRIVYGVHTEYDHLLRDIWERWSEMSAKESAQVIEKIEKCLLKEGNRVVLPIGEALLQLSDIQDTESGSVFVPFLAEVRVGQQDDDDVNVSKTEDLGNGSPPCSPQSRDTRELNVEYWLGKEGVNDFLPPTPSSQSTKKELSKSSLKAVFRSLVVSRPSHHQLLFLSFMKEKRKEKMFHKLGMKKGQKTDIDMSPVQISNISRLLCSGIGKHSDLKVSVDGCLFHGVRYFQTSAQWQTHIKSFPIRLPNGYN